jgi:formylglycine-generating enzyme required for sulfatase activity
MVGAVVLAFLYPSGDVAPARPEAQSVPNPTPPSKNTQKGQPSRHAAPPGRPVAASDKTITLDLGGNVTMTLVLIRPGTFVIGSPDSEEGHDEDEDPQHEVTISKPFYMGVTEVTQAQYKAVTGTDPSKFDGPTNPVEMVSWEDAMDFCRTLSERTGKDVRLPTEAEWEYACRAGTGTRFSFGDSESALAEYAWCETNSNDRTHPVGRKNPNAWGLYDMHGNVLEWCADWYGKYPNGASTDPRGPASGRFRVLHGGSWYHPADKCRAANRFGGGSDYRVPIFGFRVVVSGSAP